jgi:hypothetical protein
MRVKVLFEVVSAPIDKACHRVRLSCSLRADNLAVKGASRIVEKQDDQDIRTKDG